MKEEIIQATWLSNLAYSDSKDVYPRLMARGYTNFKWINNIETDTQVILCSRDKKIFVVVRGTEFTSIRDWLTNIDCTFINTDVWGFVHRGFFNDAWSVYHQVLSYVQNHIDLKEIVVGGHSQGAGVATCLAMLLSIDWHFSFLVQVASPRVASEEAANNFGRVHGSKIHRIVNNYDVVTRIPTRSMGYKHITHSNLHYFKENGNYTTHISAWEKFKDRIPDRIYDIGELGTDGNKDHDSLKYVQLTGSLKKDCY